jgi:hypothetical protein
MKQEWKDLRIHFKTISDNSKAWFDTFGNLIQSLESAKIPPSSFDMETPSKSLLKEYKSFQDLFKAMNSFYEKSVSQLESKEDLIGLDSKNYKLEEFRNEVKVFEFLSNLKVLSLDH